MKKFSLFAAVCLVALVFASCDSPNKNGGTLKVTAKVTDGDMVNSQVDEVRAVGYIYGEEIEVPVDWDGDGEVDWYEYQRESTDIIIATAPFKNGGFTITLPKQIDERLLEEGDFSYLEEYYGGKVTVSNKNFKTTIVEEFEAYKNNKRVGYFVYYYASMTSEGYAVYMFVDSDVKITGTISESEEWDGRVYTDEEIYDINLKEGWNAVYMLYSEVGNSERTTYSTSKPDKNFEWVYDGGYYYDYVKAKAPHKALKKHSSKFLKMFR
ncbi:MAG: hypothetical protein LBN95_11965 [Prevotellaceae bacterium]|jgi:hypothetical protein|nr:hypothetical protein [Prevotellaceae bacterium]